MSDENQIQTTPSDNTQAPESTQPINTDSPAPTTDSPVVEMPSEAPESPTNVVDTPPNKDDIGAVVPAESPIEEPIKTEEIPVNPVPANTTTQTAQMVGNEPIRTQSFIRGLLEKAKLAIQSRKRNKLDKIMNLFAKQTNITNDEVEKYLHVSDATATRYLSILIKEGKIKQNGKTGKAVSYYKI
ncbi:MAG: hypothetical protein WC933_01580 [Candidatus Paceibacterota bacterium]|jgi:hypothetical protein